MQTVWEFQELRGGGGTDLITPTDDSLISPLTKNLLALRSIGTAQAIDQFLFPKLENLYDPFLMKGMREAVRRILTAIDRKELILVHGDYDVDGITGAALLARALQKLKARYYTFLPDRKADGYGVSAQAIEVAKSKGVSLLLTVDCGITAVEEVKLAKENGIDVIILDHHQIHNHGLPEAFAIINPLQEGCLYPFKELSACGLAFKLAQALIGNFAFSLLDLAALSSVCDVAPLVDENRIIVRHGLDLISSRKNLG
ncbi:MAG: DHH family phosphoesterase, partial [Candidatus Omnitrophica bacterium]|nr:DHH family phosphoesterase [Candidatus Omnitrophota bacterium]